MNRAPINPDLLRWARERAGLEWADLSRRFPKLGEWEAGERLPTLRQVEDFARAVHVPVGYLFLPEPPEEPLPIPDFRTVAGRGVERPSPNLLDTLYACEERQDWFREHARMTGQAAYGFVGSLGVETPPEVAAGTIREALGIEVAQRRACRDWGEALRLFVSQADAAGILVMINGVVLNNNHRPLDPEEFRGFALADPLAPLVFINGADTKAAQMFTLAHELAHIWLGASALSDVSPAGTGDGRREEVWCNRVAAEILAPLGQVRAELRPGEALEMTLRRLTLEEILARDKVSLDIFWLRDDSLGDMDNLPEPDEIAEAIVENLEAGLEGFRRVLASLEDRAGSADSGEAGSRAEDHPSRFGA